MCMTGQARHLLVDCVANNITRTLLKPLNANLFMFVNTINTFVQGFRIEKGDDIGHAGGLKCKGMDFEGVKSLLRPKVVGTYDEADVPRWEEMGKEEAPCLWENKKMRFLYPQFWGMKKC